MFSTTKYGPGESQINERLVQAAKNFQTELRSTEAKIVQVQAAFEHATLECECLKRQNSSLRGLVTDLTNQLDRSQEEVKSLVAKKTNPAVGTQTEAQVSAAADETHTETPVPASAVATHTEAPVLNASLAHQSLALVPVSKRNEEGQFKLYQNPFNRSLLTQALNIPHRNLALPYTETGYLALVPYRAGGQQTSTAQKASLVSDNLETGCLALVPYQAGGQQTSTAQKASLVSENFQLSQMNKRLHTEKTMGTKLFAGSVVILVGIGAVIAKNPGAQDTFVKAGQVVARSVLKGVASVSTLVGKLLSPHGYVIDLAKKPKQ